jgi:aspartyl-tRNA(Asn)/glutamyl-tRNA(Gln) amidotransferase subunit A
VIQDDAFFLGLATLGRMLRSGETTSVELTRLALHRLESAGAALNAVAHLLPERALAEAAQADGDLKAGRDHGPLHGIPYGAKDLYAASGAPTEWGSFAHVGQRFEADAVAVRRLKAAGAVLVAKLAMISLAGGGGYRYASASTTGPCKTPWDTTRWAGGSSSGSGAAVGAGLVPFALGSETWGSILCPSAFCGVTGLRPTYGRVPRTGAMALSWTLDKLGPMARSAEDASLVLAALAGPDTTDHSSMVGSYKHVKRNPRGLRVGVLTEDFSGAEPGAEAAWTAAVKTLEASGMTLGDAALPDQPYGDVAGAIIMMEGRAAFADVISGPKLALLNDPEQRTGLAAGMAGRGVDYLRATQLRAGCRQAVAGVFQKFDVLVAPVYTGGAPPADANLDTTFPGGNGLLNTAGNCVGIPCVAVPMGRTDAGLPLGMQICAAAGNERAAVAAARLFQSRTHWHIDRPPGFG